MKSLWTMGELIVEIMRPRPEMPHGVIGEYIGPFPSGAPAIMISAAARMGAKTGIVGGVGKDAHGDMLVGRLEQYGVDCRYVLRSDKSSTGNAAGALNAAAFGPMEGNISPETVAEMILKGYGS